MKDYNTIAVETEDILSNNIGWVSRYVTVENRNKPDMFAIRFDREKDHPVAICMVEVKSKVSVK